MTFTEPKDWTSEHRKLLANFLESETGQLMLAWHSAHAPELLDGSDVNKTLVASGVVKGYNKSISEIISLTREQPDEVKPPAGYPDLDDESLWNKTEPK